MLTTRLADVGVPLDRCIKENATRTEWYGATSVRAVTSLAGWTSRPVNPHDKEGTKTAWNA